MRKIWNRPNLAVWSLVTSDALGQANMNICTYVTAVSMEPKQMMVAVYLGTKTLENLKSSPAKPVLLQLLSEELAPIVRVCGQLSGSKIDKIKRLKKRYQFGDESGLPFFKDAAGYLLLQPQTVTEVAGDHTLYTFSVVKQVNISDKPLLMTDTLRSQKIIR
jgi:flavin reductase (DIM6/NTAB) family NADH-FMN oxidoreductase RutF